MASSSTSKQPLMAATRCSGDRTSERRVKPRISANKMVTGRRSPSTVPRSPVPRVSRAWGSCRDGVSKRETLIKDRLVPKNLVPEHLVPQDLIPEHLVPQDLVPQHLIPEHLVPQHRVASNLAVGDLAGDLRQHGADQPTGGWQVRPAHMRGTLRHGPRYVEQAGALRGRTRAGDRSSSVG